MILNWRKDNSDNWITWSFSHIQKVFVSLIRCEIVLFFLFNFQLKTVPKNVAVYSHKNRDL